MVRSFSFAIVALATALASAQQPPAQMIENTVQVHAEGKFEAEPDTALITLTLSDKEATQEAAYQNVSSAAQRLREILRQNNIDPKRARVSSYSINPEFDWKNPKNRRPIAYQVQTSATLKLSDFGVANKLLVALSDLAYAGNQALAYTLEDMDAAKKKAIADAYANAHGYAEALAGASARKLGDLLYASVDTEEIRVPMPMRAMAYKAAQAAPPAPTEDMGQQTTTITAQVNAVFRLQ
ncbi:MAG: hypothetical protein NVS9B15_06620 [Acidobacteriaceae bacterium]